MRVLLVHDRSYGSVPGGEHSLVSRERNMLESRGVETRVLGWPTLPAGTGVLAKGMVQAQAIYSRRSYRRARTEIAAFRPDVVHVHNFWPRATPAVHAAGRHAGVPVVQSIHNYRILCAGDLLLRDGRLCELCVDSPVPWHAVRHRCMRGSLSRSVLIATAFGFHRLADTWNRCVDVFIAPTESVRARFARAGIATQIAVNPQWAPDYGSGNGARRYFLFVGRLAAEKGVSMLLGVWRRLGVELRLAGTGALEDEVRRASAEQPNIHHLGALGSAAVNEAMRGAIATIVPSLWEEPFPLVIAESYAAGTPVIAADHGSRAETVVDGETGMLFRAGDPEALHRAVSWTAANPSACAAMGRAARKRYEMMHTENAGWTRLQAIYAELRARKGEEEAR